MTASAPVSTSPASNWLSPERVAHAEFRTSFRGLDPAEVRSFLARVANELRTLLEAHETLRTAAAEPPALEVEAEVIEPASKAPMVVAEPEPLDIRKVTELLGQETARVLEVAREAANDIRSKAEVQATARLEEATTEADRLEQAAAAVLAERTEEAEAAARVTRSEADAYAASTRSAADAAATATRSAATTDAERLATTAADDAKRVKAEAAEALDAAKAQAAQVLADAKDAAAKLSSAAHADAEAERAAGREDGRRMVAEAKAVRERILADMARRRNIARQQIERVRAARERLLEAIEGVRVSVTDAQAELSGSLVEAKIAGDRAARQVDVNTLPSLRELESEVKLAKDTGLIDLRADTFGYDGDDAEGDDVEGDGDDLIDDESVIDTAEFAALTSEDLARGAEANPAVADATGDEPLATVIDLTDVERGGDGSSGPANPKRKGRGQPPAGELFARLRSLPADGGAPTRNGLGGHGALAPVALAEPVTESTTEPVAELGPETPGEAEGAESASEPAVEAESDAPGAAAPSADRVELHKRDALVAGTIRDLSRQLKLALSDQQNELLESARAQAGAKNPVGSVIPDRDELAGAFTDVVAVQLRQAAQLGWRAIAPDDVSAGDVDVDELVASMTTTLAGELHGRLERDREGRGDGPDGGNGGNEAHLAERVRGAYREVRAQRLGDLASHFVLSAFGRGQLAAAPAGLAVRWAYDSCGPDCLDNALAGPLASGTEFPTGHRHPPAFEGCRCLLVASS